MHCVVDANVLLKAFLPEQHSDLARAVVGQIANGELTAIAPQIFIAEVGHTLRRALHRKRLTAADAAQIWNDLRALPVDLHGLSELADAAWGLSLDHMGRFHDALYVALAVREDAQVITADERMVKAFGSLSRAVFLPDFVAH